MNVETMIYVYLAVCASMIIFNTVCTIVFRRQDKMVTKHAYKFAEKLIDQFELIEDGGVPEESHRKYLLRKLKRTKNLLAFDNTLDRVRAENAELTEIYLDAVYDVFFELMGNYYKKGEILTVFFLNILHKHSVLVGKPIEMVRENVLPMVTSSNVYCRENALCTLYSTGNVEIVLDALTLLERDGCKHNGKMLTDGLLEYTGDHEILSERIWERFEYYSVPMQLSLLNYFRFRSGGHKDRMLVMLNDSSRDDELRFSCIRYFGKYPDARAYETLLGFADFKNGMRWEYSAIASSALSAYPGENTFRQLKVNLHSDSWYIRYNSAQSLEAIGFDYLDMVDIFEGNDRYAKEMIQYRMDQRWRKQEEEECMTVYTT